jgi:hypothetical protein
MKKTLFFVGYNFFALIVLLFISELAVRLIKPEISVKGTTKSIIADSLYYSTHGLRPLSSGTTNGASVSVDQYGYRKSSTKIDTSKASCLFLGDSVTFGIGVEDDSTFSAIVHSQIDSLNILNPSASGNNINSYWDIFRCLVIENRHNLKISRVSLFWALNDVYTNVPDFEMPGGKLRYFFSDFITFIRIHSRLYHFVKTVAFDRPKSYYLFDKSFYNIEHPEFQNAIKKIYQMNDFCSERKIAFDIILLPYEYQLREGYFTPQNLMTEVLQNKMSVQEPFQNKRDKVSNFKAYFLYGDGIHFSTFGHRYIAKFLIDYFVNAREIGKFTS